MPPVKVINKCLGLNTRIDPFQEIDTETGAKYLSKSVNVRITDSSVIERSEPARSLLTLAAGHSLFCDGGSCLVHDGGSMYEVAAGITLSAAKRTSMSGNKISHTQAGDAIYYSNLSEHGVYLNSTSYAWSVDDFNGDDTDRVFETSIPFFGKIAYFNGYMLGAIDNALYASELGYMGVWEMKPVWLSDTEIIMIRPIDGGDNPQMSGVYVSDLKRQFFLAGFEPKNFIERKVADYPAIEWAVSHELIDASIFMDTASGRAAVWKSQQGDCIGLPGGQMINNQKKAIKFPVAGTTGAVLIHDHYVISTIS